MTYDINSIIQDASNLAHLLDVVLEMLCGIERDREEDSASAAVLDRAESLTIIGRDLAERIAGNTGGNFAALSRPQRVAA